MDGEAAFHHGLDNGSVRHLDGNPDGLRLGVGRGAKPVRHLHEAVAAVRKAALCQYFAVAVKHAGLVDSAIPNQFLRSTQNQP